MHSALRERLGAAVTVAGIAAAVPSIQQTVSHITDDTYRAPEVRHGEGHVQYHMAREALITVGSIGAIGVGLLAGPRRGRPLWWAMASAATGFAAAMWSGGPTTGKWAPNRTALLVHLASTTGLAVGIALLRPGRERS
ncbi:hypothetical protein GCM10010174_77830 [Kutzneria viridogrisea]|uniref:Secreted protein n=2 Tax=Kutzneria TaxID=43356 RepID=A0ABR6BJC4_9PSEU|nr:hypothetical protein [Kutzneria albida]AHH95653.1 putative secreted protein [Kutzneria albida DSM 43870]MBA8926984.1 hypothetical protein [Kutzneria viridogrisea]